MLSRLSSSKRILNSNLFNQFNPNLVNNSNIIKRTTTILCVRRNNEVVLAGDGQVTQGSVVLKGGVRKVRKLKGNILVGFAGSTADALTLLDRLEGKLEEHSGQLTRACVELAKAWRSDKYLRRLEASIIVADDKVSFELTGNGDVLEPSNGIVSIGSGGSFALSAATALLENTDMSAEDIVKKSMKIAGDMCIYTNHNIIVEKLEIKNSFDDKKEEKKEENKEEKKEENKEEKKEEN